MQNHNDNYISDLVKGTINILIDDLKNKTEPEISCEITCTLTCSGDYFDSDNFKRKRQIDKDYEEGIITKEEKAKKLSDITAENNKSSYFLYFEHPNIINLSQVYDGKEPSHIVKIIIVFQRENTMSLDEIFERYNIKYNKRSFEGRFVFYEFIFEFEPNSFVVDGAIWNPNDSYSNGINIPRFNSIIRQTPLKSIFGDTNYELSGELYRLPYELFICLNNGDSLHSLAIRDTLRNLEGIQPRYYKDLNCTFRSSWEANIARVLNYNRVKWTYEEIGLVLSGKNENEPIFYTPDFYLEDNDIIVEIKGFWNKYSLEKVYACKHKKFVYPSNVKNSNTVFQNCNYYIIDSDMFVTLEKVYPSLVPNWEPLTVSRKAQDIFVVGINRLERTKFVKALKNSEKITLQRDLDNKFDEFAIQALNTNGDMLGFVSKEWACIYAEKLDMGMEFEAVVKKIDSTYLTLAVKRINYDVDILYDFLKPKMR